MRASLTLPPAGRVLLHLLLLSVWTLMLAATTSAAAAADADAFTDHQIPDDLPPDDGSGPDDEDMSDLFGGVVHSDVTFRCYKCTGFMNQSGCNMTSFNQDPSDFITECSGHCLNISTADSTVFECTPEVPTKEAACFTKGGMKMCFCSTDLCNGFPVAPVPALVLPPSQRETGLVTSQHGQETGHNATTTSSRQNETVLTPPHLHDSDIVVAGTPQHSGDEKTGVMPSRRKDTGSSSSTSQDKEEDNASLTSREIERRLVTSLRDGSRSGRRGNNVTFPEPSLHRQTNNNNTYIQAGGSTSGADLVVRVCASFSVMVTLAWGVHYNWLG